MRRAALRLPVLALVGAAPQAPPATWLPDPWPPAAEVEGRARGTPADTVTLHTEGPNLEFIPTEITVKAGSHVTLRYTNGGDLPHNLALFRDDADIDIAVNAAYEAQATGFIPTELADKMIAYTPLLSPGQTVDIDFEAPPPGDYTYICLFPGHATMMLGVLHSLP